MTLIDIGVNLTNSTFEKDLDQVVEDARLAGVAELIITGTSIEESEAALKISESYPDCYTTAGIHPHHASEFNQNSIDTLRDLTKHPMVKAVGETGLDFNRNFSTPADQIKAFERQLELACDLQLPVFLHQRDAHKTFLPILKSCRDQLNNAVAHCFTGTRQELYDYLDLDMHIGITGWICDERRGIELQNIVKDIPLNRLMLETDAPYLLPRTIQPKPKSRRNEPAFLNYVLKKVAECMGVEEAKVAEQTTQTARRFFRLDKQS